MEGTYKSLPFGDVSTSTGTDSDANHYAQLDHDAESGSDHAQARQYSELQGRWLSPDPYSGSYNVSNPQSMNRYVYALNNPLSIVDPSGLSGLESQGCVTEFGDKEVGGDLYPNEQCGKQLPPGAQCDPDLNTICSEVYTWDGTTLCCDYQTVNVTASSCDSVCQQQGNANNTMWLMNEQFSQSMNNLPQEPSGNGKTAQNGGTKVSVLSPKPQQKKHQCSDIERLSKAWHGVETVGTVGVGVGTAVTGFIGLGVACASGNLLLCVAGAEAAPGFIAGGYYVAKSALQELKEPNNPDFGGDCK